MRLLRRRTQLADTQLATPRTNGPHSDFILILTSTPFFSSINVDQRESLHENDQSFKLVAYLRRIFITHSAQNVSTYCDCTSSGLAESADISTLDVGQWIVIGIEWDILFRDVVMHGQCHCCNYVIVCTRYKCIFPSVEYVHVQLHLVLYTRAVHLHGVPKMV
jgi:hypothetical protein